MGIQSPQAKTDRHLKTIPIASNHLDRFLRGEFSISEATIPTDAVFVRAIWDWQMDSLLVCYEHDSFPICHEYEWPEIDRGYEITIRDVGKANRNSAYLPLLEQELKRQ